MMYRKTMMTYVGEQDQILGKKFMFFCMREAQECLGDISMKN